MATRRLYVPLSVSTHLDDRVAEAGDAAELLWYRLLQVVKANETDGQIGHAQAVKLHSKRAVDALVRVGLLRAVDDGKRYAIAGWSDWNLSSAQIEARRRADRERKAGGKPDDSGPFPSGKRAESADDPGGIQTESSGTLSAGALSEVEVEVEGKVVGTSVGSLDRVAPGPSDPPPATQPAPAPGDLLAATRAGLARTRPLHAITGAKAVGA